MTLPRWCHWPEIASFAGWPALKASRKWIRRHLPNSLVCPDNKSSSMEDGTRFADVLVMLLLSWLSWEHPKILNNNRITVVLQEWITPHQKNSTSLIHDIDSIACYSRYHAIYLGFHEVCHGQKWHHRQVSQNSPSFHAALLQNILAKRPIMVMHFPRW